MVAAARAVHLLVQHAQGADAVATARAQHLRPGLLYLSPCHRSWQWQQKQQESLAMVAAAAAGRWLQASFRLLIAGRQVACLCVQECAEHVYRTPTKCRPGACMH